MDDNYLKNALEDLIDASSVERVCLAMASVCLEKSEHIASNWQDTTTARPWTQMAQRLNTVAGAAERRGV